jgi:electron transport complex protein RnfG
VSDAAAGTDARRLIVTLGGVAALSGLLVVLAYQISLPRIEANRQQAIERAVLKVIPGAVTRRTYVLGSDRILRAAGADATGTPVYAGYDAAGRLRGVALEGAAQGYQSVIRLLYGYSPACACIVGMEVLQAAETPGLGDKIAWDADFLANFRALDVRLDAAGADLAHAVVAVRHGRKNAAWQVDAISGATVSSKAVTKALDQSARTLLPPLLPQIHALEASPP